MEALRRPLVALLLAPDEEMWEAALTGAKRISIREGARDYQAGDTLMLCCHIRDSSFMAKVAEVRHCKLGEVTQDEYTADGFDTQASLLSGLQSFYPNMTLDSVVTIVRWDDIRGTAVSRAILC